jgi:hypothetical protein
MPRFGWVSLKRTVGYNTQLEHGIGRFKFSRTSIARILAVELLLCSLEVCKPKTGFSRLFRYL